MPRAIKFVGGYGQGFDRDVEEVFNFKPIPGFSDRYLVRVNNTYDNKGLIRAVSIGLLMKKSYSALRLVRKNATRHIRCYLDIFDMIHQLDEKKMTFDFDDLELIQEVFDNRYGNKYNILVFDASSQVDFKHPYSCRIEPVFEGNPLGKYPFAILRYQLDGRTEYCCMSDIGKAFNVRNYCVKCRMPVYNLKEHGCNLVVENNFLRILNEPF